MKNIYSHCFNRYQLRCIIEQYLDMSPYYQALDSTMKHYLQQYEKSEVLHHKEKSHPVRIYLKYGVGEEQIFYVDRDNGGMKYTYVYPVGTIISILHSEEFYKMLPKNLMVNTLLTTTNINIIIETVKIVAVEFSKKIKSTVLSRINKDKKKNKNIYEQHKPKEVNRLKQQTIISETKKSSHPLQSYSENYKSCIQCETYLIYLLQLSNEFITTDLLNKFTKESIQLLKLLSQTVTNFTLYLVSTNQVYIPDDLAIFNKVLNSMDVVITQDVYECYNSKKLKHNTDFNQKDSCKTKNKTLCDQLKQYFHEQEYRNKKKPDNMFSIEELFQMVINAPKVSKVKQKLKEKYNREDNEKSGNNRSNFGILEDRKNYNDKEFMDYKEIMERNKTMMESRVHTRPAFEQLIPLPENNNVLPKQNYLGKNKGFSKKGPWLSKNKTSSQKNTLNGMMESSSKVLKGNKKTKSKGNFSKCRSYVISNQSEMAQNFKKNTINNLSSCKTKQKQQIAIQPILINNESIILKENASKTSFQKDNSQTPRRNLFKSSKPYNQNGEDEQNSDFKLLMYNFYMKKNGMLKQSKNNLESTNNFQNTINMAKTRPRTDTITKNEKFNEVQSNLQKQKQQQDAFEKQQRENYQKMLLNGVFARDQIYQQLRSGKAQLVDDFFAQTQCDHIKESSSKKSIFTSSSLAENYASYFSNSPLSSAKQIQYKILNSSLKKSNIISLNSAKINNSGIIRNQKFNKIVKNQMINHRLEYQIEIEKRNTAKQNLKKRPATANPCNTKKTIKQHMPLKIDVSRYLNAQT